MNESKIGPDELKRIADIDLAIHSPARMKILAFLSVVESADFTFLMNQTGLTRGNLSSHMSRLEEVGYVSIKKEFVDRVPRTLISLTDEGRSAILTYRENMRQVLDEILAS